MFAFKFNLKFNFRSINCLSLRSFGGVSATTQSHSVRALVQNRFVIVETMSKHDATQGNQLRFPLVWLRDNCQCGECFHAFSMSRTIDWTTFDFTKAQPKKVSIEDGLKITWGDSHESVFRLDWLNERNFSTEKRNNYLQNVYKPQPLLWSKDNLPLEQFHYGDIMDSNGSLAAWLKSLAINGVTLIKNAPLDENVCRNLAERVGFIRKTHYGEEFIVKAKENTSNVAYLSSPLQMHTDLPYYDYKPGVNLLHCIVQSTSPGAFNLLTDGFYVAERMRSECPQSYETLTQTLVNWSDYGEEDGNRFQKINRSPVICLDREGNLQRINHSVPQRDSFFTIDADAVDEWYRAMMKFVQMVHEESVALKTQPGDVLSFSNIRLLHGRTGYVDSNGNTRHLVGAYLDWDEIYSRLRVLAMK